MRNASIVAATLATVLLDKEQIIKKFKLGSQDDGGLCDAGKVLEIQARGVEHGKAGTVFKDDDAFNDAVGWESQQLETLMFAPEGSVRRLYNAAVREGKAIAKASAAPAPVMPKPAKRNALKKLPAKDEKPISWEPVIAGNVGASCT